MSSIEARLTALDIPEAFIKTCIQKYSGPKHDEELIAYVVWSWRQNHRQSIDTVNFVHQSKPTPMTEDWQPDEITFDALEKQGIKRAFSEFYLMEFKNYWIEQGSCKDTWNSYFIRYINHQVRYFHKLEKRMGRATIIPLDWRPSLMAFELFKKDNIELDFAIDLVAEFVMYWHESERQQYSWNAAFISYVREQWKKRHYSNNEQSTRNMAWEDQFDTAWAE